MFDDTLDGQLTNTTLKVTPEIKEFFITAAKWSRFLSIILFIMTGFIFIAAIAMLIIGMRFSAGGQVLLMAAIYIGMGVVYVFLGLYMARFAKNAISSMENNKQGDFHYSIENLKNFFKLSGIITIVVISLYLIMLVIGAGAIAMLR